MIKLFLLITSITLLLPTKTSPEFAREVIVWNVGQGLWVTALESHSCLHFDAGGEKQIFFKIIAHVEKRCRSKLNLFSFSHWDLDHISFIAQIYKRNFNSCILNYPGGQTQSSYKKKWLGLLPKCSVTESKIKEIKFPFNPKISNEHSRVFIFNKKFILPGDSASQNEKFWAPQIPFAPIPILVLGHHGSRTSTSKFLLEELPNLKLAVASAKFSRYGHPHTQVRRRLKKFGVSLLETEVWGNVHFR